MDGGGLGFICKRCRRHDERVGVEQQMGSSGGGGAA